MSGVFSRLLSQAVGFPGAIIEGVRPLLARLTLFAIVVALVSASVGLLLTMPAPPRASLPSVHIVPPAPQGPPPAWIAATEAALAREQIAAIKAAQAGHPVPTAPAPPDAWLAGPSRPRSP